MNGEIHPCQLCGRGFNFERLTKHHCLPRQKGGDADRSTSRNTPG
jgi:hypothetical protein